jgi:hypothetical protein
MITFISNLYSVLTKAPAVIGLIKAIIDIVGSTEMTSIINSIKDALQKESPAGDTVKVTESDKIRLGQRIRNRIRGTDN